MIEINLDLDDGKYTIIESLAEDGTFKALRNGEEWRDLRFDGLILALIYELERVKKEGATNARVIQLMAADVMELHNAMLIGANKHLKYIAATEEVGAEVLKSKETLAFAWLEQARKMEGAEKPSGCSGCAHLTSDGQHLFKCTKLREWAFIGCMGRGYACHEMKEDSRIQELKVCVEEAQVEAKSEHVAGSDICPDCNGTGNLAPRGSTMAIECPACWGGGTK